MTNEQTKESSTRGNRNLRNLRHLVTLISLQIGRFMTNPSGFSKRRCRISRNGRKLNNRISDRWRGLIRLVNMMDRRNRSGLSWMSNRLIRRQRDWQRANQNRRTRICRREVCTRGSMVMLIKRCGVYGSWNSNWTIRRIKAWSSWSRQRNKQRRWLMKIEMTEKKGRQTHGIPYLEK